MTQIVKHPAFPDVQQAVEDADVDRWKAAGWEPLLNAVQRRRFDELAAEADAAQLLACPTCGAVGSDPCVTVSGNETKRHAARPVA